MKFQLKWNSARTGPENCVRLDIRLNRVQFVARSEVVLLWTWLVDRVSPLPTKKLLIVRATHRVNHSFVVEPWQLLKTPQC